MTLEELIAAHRRDTDDLQPDYLSSDADITYWLNEGEQEAALRARLIHDTSGLHYCGDSASQSVQTAPGHHRDHPGHVHTNR